MKPNHIWISLSVAGTLALTSCQKGPQVKNERSGSEQKPEEQERILDQIDVAKQDFSSSVSDGRGVVQTTWANMYQNIDFTKVHPKTAEFYQLSSPTNVHILVEPERRDVLWNFTNFQDSVRVDDIVAGLQRGCKEEGYPNIKSCVDDAIKRSGAVVFEMKTKLGNAKNLNDPNHIRDALFGLMGLTFLHSPTPGGGTELRASASCVGCHNSTYAKANGSNVALMLDPRGDNSYADVLKHTDFAANFEEFKKYVANPSDPIWSISSETKAAGYLAAQYMKLKDQYGPQYGYTEEDIPANAHKVNIKSAVDAGWVSAFANWIVTANPWCHQYDTSCKNPSGNSPETVAKLTEKTTALRVLTERQNMVQPWSVIAPLRAQRSVLFAPSNIQAVNRMAMPSEVFAMDYLFYRGGEIDPRRNALPYLLSATAASVVFPGVTDAALASAWYQTTPDQADTIVKAELPRTIPEYAEAARKYHEARYWISKPVPSSHVQTLTLAEANLGNTQIKNTCFSCHTSAKTDITSTWLTANCQGKAECIAATNLMDNSGAYSMHTPTSQWAQSVMTPTETAPAAFNTNYYDEVFPNNDLKSFPYRIPLLKRQALGLWGFTRFADAVKPNGQRPAPGYAIVSPRLALDRTVPFRTVGLNFDFDGNGVIGAEQMFCAKTKMYDLDGDGIKETTCFDALRAIGGGTPRPINSSDAIDIVHKNIVTFPTTTANQSALAKMIAAYADGAFRVRFPDNTISYVKIKPVQSTEGCLIGESCNPTGDWPGFSGAASSGSSSGSGGGSTIGGGGLPSGGSSGGSSSGGGLPGMGF